MGSWPLHFLCSVLLDTEDSSVASGLAPHRVLGKEHVRSRAMSVLGATTKEASGDGAGW